VHPDAEPYPRIDAPPPDDATHGSLGRLVLLALVGGALAGLVGGLFRRALVWADVARTTLLDWTREEPALRWIIPVACAAAAVALARLLVRWVPDAGGSGVQRVEANMRSESGFAPWQVVPAKFLGGFLAIGAGLALGREGPSVQMGAAIGSEAGRVGGVNEHDRRTLSAALAGAGLGVAFSAPLGGAVFVFEEVSRAVRTRLVVTTLAGSAAAVAVAHQVVEDGPILPIPDVESVPLWTLLIFVVLGALLGAMGVAYNRMVIVFLDLMERLPSVPPEAKAAVIGGLVGLLGILSPAVVGGGEELNEAILLGRYSLGGLLLVLAVRWILGPVSYAAGAPGGLFAPLLVVGAAAGAILAEAANALVPALDLSPLAFAVVGMSTFFSAVVRAPLTGVILIVEMTATTSLLVPMLIAAAAAVVTATLMRGPPVYDSLRERLPSQDEGRGRAA
jgi:CIC family chloride channel protein